jgi:myosin-5
MENAKLNTDLASLRMLTAKGGQELLKQLEASQLELDRQVEECIQLHSVLANQAKELKSVANNNYSSHVDIINEDGKPVLVFDPQKEVNRLLEDKLQAEKATWQSEREAYKKEIDRLRDVNDRQPKMLSMNIWKDPQTQTEELMHHEIIRLSAEKLDLQEKIVDLSEQYRK